MKRYILYSLYAISLVIAAPLTAYTFEFKNFTLDDMDIKFVAGKEYTYFLPAMRDGKPGVTLFNADKDSLFCLELSSFRVRVKGDPVMIGGEELWYDVHHRWTVPSDKGNSMHTFNWVIDNKSFDDDINLNRHYWKKLTGGWDTLACYNRVFAILPLGGRGYMLVTWM